MDDDGAARAELAQGIRRRHRIMTDGVHATDAPVGTNTDLLFGEWGPTHQFAENFRRFGITQPREHHLAPMVIKDAICLFAVS